MLTGHTLYDEEGKIKRRLVFIKPSFENFKCVEFGFKMGIKAIIQLEPGDERGYFFDKLRPCPDYRQADIASRRHDWRIFYIKIKPRGANLPRSPPPYIRQINNQPLYF